MAERGRAGASRRARADRADAGGRLQPRRALPARVPRCTSASCAAPWSRRSAPPLVRRSARRRRGPVRGVHRRDPLRARDRVPRQRAGEARRDPVLGAARAGPRAGERRRADGETPRVAIIADGIGSTHGVTRTIAEIRQRGVPGFEIEVIGTDPEVDRRLSAVTEIDVPFYPGLRIGVPSLPAAVQTLAADGAASTRSTCARRARRASRGARRARARAAAAGQLPHRADRVRGTALRRAARGRHDGARRGRVLRRLRHGALPQPRLRRAPCGARDAGERVLRWDRGVDTSRFDPALRDRSRCRLDQRPLLRPHHAREGRRAARGRVPARA